MTIDDEPKLPRFITLAQAAERLCVGRSALFDILSRGELSRIKLGPKKTVLLERDVSDFINKKFDEARQSASA